MIMITRMPLGVRFSEKTMATPRVLHPITPVVLLLGIGCPMWAGGSIKIDPYLHTTPPCEKDNAVAELQVRWIPSATQSGTASNFNWTGSKPGYTVVATTASATVIQVSRNPVGGVRAISVSATWDFTWTNSKGESKTESKTGSDSSSLEIRKCNRGSGWPVTLYETAEATKSNYPYSSSDKPTDSKAIEFGIKYTGTSSDVCHATYVMSGTVTFSGHTKAEADAPKKPFFGGEYQYAFARAEATGTIDGTNASTQIAEARSGTLSVTYGQGGSVGLDGKTPGVSISLDSSAEYILPQNTGELPISGTAPVSKDGSHAPGTDLRATESGSMVAVAMISMSGPDARARATARIRALGTDAKITFTPDRASCP